VIASLDLMPFLEYEGYYAFASSKAQRLFWCVKLEHAVLLRALLEFFLCLLTVWLIVFFSTNLGVVIGLKSSNQTRLMEFIICLAGLLFSGLGVHAILRFRGARAEEGEYGSARMSAASRLLRYLLFSSFRVILTIPIIGTNVISENICGMFVHGIASITGASTTGSGGLHCSFYDMKVILLILVILALDIYTLWGTFCLRQLYRYGLPTSLKSVEYLGPSLSPKYRASVGARLMMPSTPVVQGSTYGGTVY